MSSYGSNANPDDTAAQRVALATSLAAAYGRTADSAFITKFGLWAEARAKGLSLDDARNLVTTTLVRCGLASSADVDRDVFEARWRADDAGADKVRY